MYEFTALYLYKAVFMAELLVAEFLMCIGMKRRPLFALRFALCCVLCIGIAFALPVLAYNALYCSAAFLVMFAATLPAIKWCYADNMTSVVFRAMAAYTVQHIAYQAFAFIMFFVGLMFGGNNFAGGVYGDGSASELFPIIVYGVSGDILSSSPMMYAFLSLFAYSAYFIVYIITYTLSYRFVSPLLKNSDKFELRNSSLLIFVGCFVLFNVVISSVVTYYSEEHNDILYVSLLSLYNIACCIFTMFLMFEVIFRKQYERDYVTAARMLKQSEERYALTKENIELINMKCHDLKHQIRLIRSSPAADSAALGEIEDLIQVYDSAIRTGNEALDIILAEKSLYCNRHGIRLYCIADGALLSFIADSDLYALFGNLLDNAIEAVEELEGDRRFINLSIKKINGFATLSMSNCHSRPLDFRDGLPATTKQDKSVHGYGMKSVRLICKKYDAELILNDDNGVFTVKIVFMQ